MKLINKLLLLMLSIWFLSVSLSSNVYAQEKSDVREQENSWVNSGVIEALQNIYEPIQLIQGFS
ncbi:hypothetical protein KC980_02210 [candidate division WWE3 bacterium]|uniref:Uncharacterized protein n=1 Tax=candidate division WWE3 bacterium TaxID=2053526 RepID=A0A955EF55_UNCKA|nr:hypothetical protein [candidate division WWE3 bacterium]